MSTIASKLHNWSLLRMWSVNLDDLREGGSASSAVNLFARRQRWPENELRVLPRRRPGDERSVGKGEGGSDEGDEEASGGHHGSERLHSPAKSGLRAGARDLL
jgi:hypothetical protein